MQRRLRVLTTPLRVARNAHEVYENASAEAVLVVLLHKISQAAREDGLQGARALLRRWIATLSAKHNLARASTQEQPISSPGQVYLYPTVQWLVT